VTPKQFAAYLKKHKLSQRQIALELDVSRNTVAYYLDGSWEIPRVFEFALCELENRIEAEKKNAEQND